jgi:hypothetical protein
MSQPWQSLEMVLLPRQYNRTPRISAHFLKWSNRHHDGRARANSTSSARCFVRLSFERANSRTRIEKNLCLLTVSGFRGGSGQIHFRQGLPAMDLRAINLQPATR